MCPALLRIIYEKKDKIILSFQAKDVSSAFRTQIFITWQLDQAHRYLLESAILLPINLIKILEFLFVLKKRVWERKFTTF